MTTMMLVVAWRAMYPSLLARIVNQVGRPAMLDGNRLLPLTGIPIWNRARSRTLLAVWLPDPLTVATWMLKSLMTGCTSGGLLVGSRAARGGPPMPARYPRESRTIGRCGAQGQATHRAMYDASGRASD